MNNFEIVQAVKMYLTNNYILGSEEELVKETIIAINEIINAIKYDTDNFIYDIEEELRCDAELYDLCSVCGENLSYRTYDEDREYFGSCCYESITESFCENCDSL